MDENTWLETMLRRFRRPFQAGGVGVGDDAAVIRLPPGEAAVLTVDSMVEGIHFQNLWLTDRELGSRILRINLSDLAAMAARPRGALLAIETPRLPGRVGHEFWTGVEETLEEFEFELLGGNVTLSSGPLSISATLLGSVRPGREVRRDRARIGDHLWVTGYPGRAGSARRTLERGEEGAGAKPCPWRVPAPRVNLALELSAGGCLHAAIDISDGLGIDLHRLLRASGVGARIDITPFLSAAPAVTTADVLEGGEDYELIVVTPPTEAADLARWQRATPRVPLTYLGVVTATPTLSVRAHGEDLAYEPRGWSPFG